MIKSLPTFRLKNYYLSIFKEIRRRDTLREVVSKTIFIHNSFFILWILMHKFELKSLLSDPIVIRHYADVEHIF